MSDVTLEASSPTQRAAVAEVAATVARWPGFSASVASKVLHPRLPALVPVLDSRRIFGAYANPAWPSAPARSRSVFQAAGVRTALDLVHADLTRDRNQAAWSWLGQLRPARTRLQLFEMVWRSYFSRLEVA